jgi:hypothetical protein
MTGRSKEQRQEENIKECKDSSRNREVLKGKTVSRKRTTRIEMLNKYLENECGEERREMVCV